MDPFIRTPSSDDDRRKPLAGNVSTCHLSLGNMRANGAHIWKRFQMGASGSDGRMPCADQALSGRHDIRNTADAVGESKGLRRSSCRTLRSVTDLGGRSETGALPPFLAATRTLRT